MGNKLAAVLKYLALAGVLAWCCMFFLEKIDLSTADLGRHILNGRVFFEQGPASEVLRANYFSYTHPDFPFINHHWGAGVLFYLVYEAAGFSGLSVFYVLLGAATFALYFMLAKRFAGTLVALALGVMLMPLFATRNEVRPEMFTYFFSGLFFWLLWLFWEGKLGRRHMWLLPALTVIWANLHIGFFFGPLLAAIFAFFSLPFFPQGSLEKFKTLFFVFLAAGALSVLNPNGIWGALYPLKIFQNYGYMVVENQSIGFLEKLGRGQGMNFNLYKTAFALLAGSFFLVLARNRRAFSLPLLALAATVSIMGFFGIRNFPFFGLFAMAILAYNIRAVCQDCIYGLSTSRSPGIKGAYIAAACVLVILASGYRDFLRFSQRDQVRGIGLLPGVGASAEFFLANKISGPIFNNYDVGSYLSFYLYPKSKVFVDNRPEAYPAEFFREIYVPAQEDEGRWQELDGSRGFNAIFFSHRDFTPWGQKFLISRVQDPRWAVVFADGYNIIFAKRNEKNAALISRYELPKEMFRTVPQ